MKTHIFRLAKGMDLFNSIKDYCDKNNLKSGAVVSSVGCVYKAKIRNAGGNEIIDLNEKLEIISLNGTVSKERCHIHVSFSKTDLSVVGGHLVEGCLVNTTAEIVIIEFEDYYFGKEFDENTGYNELKISKI